MGYLEFTKQEVTNLQESLKREFLRTNRAGSYASSTIINCNTRKYHGLLVCPLKQIDGDNYVLLSSLDETVIQHDTPFHLAIHKYISDYNPLGHKYIESFQNDPTPTVVYRVGGVVLQKEMLLVEEEERVLVKYTLLKATSKTTLQLRPFLAFRKVHELTHANMYANTRHIAAEHGIASKLYEEFPYLYMQISKKNEFVTAPDWYNNFEYAKERERGFACHEDLFTPGYFEFEITPGESIIFSAGIQEVKTKTLLATYSKELEKRTPRSNFENCLVNAAQQFIARSGNKTKIVASFPWPGYWGRDSMIALPGLTLALNDIKTCEDVLLSFSDEIDGFVYRNKGNIEHSNVESIDTALWFIRSVQQYNWNTKDFAKTKKLFAKKVEEILSTYMSGENSNVFMHDNGLLYLPFEHKALTWVDAKIEGRPIIPRWGYVVEINALWYNAIKFALELIPSKSFQDKWKHIPAKIEESFIEVFWDEDKGYLADYCANDYKDFSVRPSQIFAASLPFSVLDDMQKHAVLDVVRRELLTPRGIRTLSPKNPQYKGEVKGTIQERDIAYHQGGVLVWLLAPYAEAYLKLHGRSGVTEIKRIYYGMETLMNTHGIGTISEVYDGNPPHEGRGAISQAWSVAAVLRLKKLIENFEADEQLK